MLDMSLIREIQVVKTIMRKKTLRDTFLLSTLALLAGCIDGGSSNSDGDSPLPPPPSDPGVYIDTSSATEGDSGESLLTFSVTLNKKLDGPISVNWETQNGSADELDYRTASGVITIDAGKTSAKATVGVYGDELPEFTENFDILLSNLVNHSSETVVLARTTGKALILNDDGTYLDTQPLNDSGLLACLAQTSDDLSRCENGKAVAEQDAHFGRDREALDGTLYKKGAGWAGFDFSKLDDKGKELPSNASKWNCVRDNHTGLVWETKTTDNGLQDRFNTYSWYFEQNTLLDGGDNGTSNAGECTGGIACDTQSYIDAINSKALCGRPEHWRLPTPEEQRSINDFSRGYTTRPTLDAQYFTNAPSVVDSSLYQIGVWSMISYYPRSGIQNLDRAMGFNYQHGGVISGQKSRNALSEVDALYVRLVNGN